MAQRVRLRSGERQWTARVDAGRVSLDDAADVFVVDQGTTDADEFVVEHGGVRLTGAAVREHERVWVMVEGDLFDFTIEGDGQPRRAAGHDQSALMPPMPATVLRVNVRAGDGVADGDVLMVLEAMKMELSIRAPRDGVVRAVHCQEGELVQPDTVLIELEDVAS
jgi:3-methylcrotonyl-CoA carboxylase alpha subunit